MTTISTEPDLAASDTLPVSREALAQRLLGLPPSLGLPHELYAKRLSGRVHLERTGFRMETNSHVSTNTYFGRVPASYWQRWTAVDSMVFEADHDGEGAVEIF